MKKQARLFLILFVLILSLTWINPDKTLCGPLIPVGSTLPGFKLDAPTSPEDCAYLGVKQEEKFKISDLSSKLIVIEFFSTFCQKCHAQAPVAEKLYKLIEGDPNLKNNVKMFAVALASQPDTVVAFSKKHDLTFPQLVDKDGKIMLKLKIGQVPQTLVITKRGKVLANHSGMIQDLDEILKEIRSGLAQK